MQINFAVLKVILTIVKRMTITAQNTNKFSKLKKLAIMKTSNIITIDQLKNENPVFASFIEFYEKEQNGANDYTVGAIQAVNSLLPIIAKLLINQK